MPRCCAGASCACKIEAGSQVIISGSGTSQDPFVVSVDSGLAVADNTVFDMTLAGTGSDANPWTLSVAYAATAKLDDIPDVFAPAPTNAQVLGWNTTNNRWQPQNPTTAASGSVSHDNSLSGDGSGGAPLAVQTDSSRLLGSFSTGLGLSDVGINQTVRKFTDPVARAAALLAPTVNTLSELDTNPGVVEYWTGTQWSPIKDNFDTVILGSALLEMSGPYNGTRLTYLMKNVAVVADTVGVFPILEVADLAGRAGVLMCAFQETGSLAFKVMVSANVDHIDGTAYTLVSGVPYAGQVITGTAFAWLY